MSERQSHTRKWLSIARLVGASAVTLVGISAVDMPGRFLGPANEMTTIGMVYAAVLVAVTTLVCVGLGRRSSWARHGSPAVLAVNTGLFVPALTSDPLVASLVVLWQMVIATLHYFPVEELGFRPHTVASSPVVDDVDWTGARGRAIAHLSMVALVLTMGVVGYEVGVNTLAMATCAAVTVAAAAVAAPFLYHLYRNGHRGVILALIPLVASLFAVFEPRLFLGFLAGYQLVVLIAMLAIGPLFNELLTYFLERPVVLVLVAFATLALLGTVLLTFPAASATSEAIAPIDALFTAMSATCVTGLIVLDTPNDFSTFGHLVILGLIQVGGLGIMVLSTYATLLLGGKLGLRGERALGELLDIRDTRTAYRLAGFVVTSTLIMEAIGAALLSVGYARHGLAWGEAVWRGIFHSISAFCNAGFALQSDSIVMFQEDPLVISVFAVLIILGGIGFIVLAGIWQMLRPGRTFGLTVQAKIVLIVSVILVLAGWLLYAAVEWDASLAGLGVGDKVVNALFQSVTLRTAGFNSVDFGSLRGASALFMIVFMFIGASPGGTGGGVKTTTVFLLGASLRSIAVGEPRVIIFGRRIPQRIIYRSAGIVLITMLVVLVVFFALLLTETSSFEVLAFEVVSAVGTVGLSLGATGELSPIGKFIITAVMFIGRTGPLSVALLLGRGAAGKLDYPTAEVMVG